MYVVDTVSCLGLSLGTMHLASMVKSAARWELFSLRQHGVRMPLHDTQSEAADSIADASTLLLYAHALDPWLFYTQVCAKCQGPGHIKAVTALLPLSNSQPGGGDMLISASLDGSIMVWDPSTNLPKGPEKEVTAKHTIKAHADGVLSMALFQAAVDTPDAQPLHLCTTGLPHT